MRLADFIGQPWGGRKLVDEWMRFMKGICEPVDVHAVQTDDYEDKLWLLVGSTDFSKIRKALEGDEDDTALTAFRRMVQHAAKQVGATYVVVDMGPCNDDITRNIVLNSDVLQPTARADSFSWASVMSLLLNILPAWNGYRLRLRKRIKSFAITFPQVMPVLVCQYSLARKGSSTILHTDSNLIQSMSTTVDIIHRLALHLKGEKGEEEEEEEDEGDARELAIVKDQLLDSTVDHEQRVIDFQAILRRCVFAPFNPTGPVAIFPFIPSLTTMAVCHEMGRVIWDAATKEVHDDYYQPGQPGRFSRAVVYKQLNIMSEEAASALKHINLIVGMYHTLYQMRYSVGAVAAAGGGGSSGKGQGGGGGGGSKGQGGGGGGGGGSKGQGGGGGGSKRKATLPPSHPNKKNRVR